MTQDRLTQIRAALAYYEQNRERGYEYPGLAAEDVAYLLSLLHQAQQALEPFAKAWDVLTPYHGLPADNVKVATGMALTYGDLRRARAVSEQLGET